MPAHDEPMYLYDLHSLYAAAADIARAPWAIREPADKDAPYEVYSVATGKTVALCGYESVAKLLAQLGDVGDESILLSRDVRLVKDERLIPAHAHSAYARMMSGRT